VVILGGIFTSTFLNMIVTPALYLKFACVEGRENVRVLARREQATAMAD